MIKPLYDRVLVLPIKDEVESELIMPESKSEKMQKGTVISVGDFNPETGKPPIVKENDIVLFGAFQGVPISDKGIDYLVIRERNIEVIL